jgi:DNA-binding response OmpR family regulator
MRGLIVSKSPELRGLIAAALGSLGRRAGESLDVTTETNGERAVMAAWRDGPEVIVADEVASRMGAFGLAKDLRDATKPFRGVIVILLDRPHDGWLARWSGADAWFVKPFDAFALADTVWDLVHENRDRDASAAALAAT